MVQKKRKKILIRFHRFFLYDQKLSVSLGLVGIKDSQQTLWKFSIYNFLVTKIIIPVEQVKIKHKLIPCEMRVFIIEASKHLRWRDIFLVNTF